MSGLFVWYFWSLGLKCCLVWCPLRPAPCSDCCSLSSLSSLRLLGCSSTTFFFLFLSLSLSQALGNHKPLRGLGFPLCFFVLDADSDFDPYALLLTFTQVSAPHTCFFLFFRRRRVVLWWWLFLPGLSVCLFSACLPSGSVLLSGLVFVGWWVALLA